MTSGRRAPVRTGGRARPGRTRTITQNPDARRLNEEKDMGTRKHGRLVAGLLVLPLVLAACSGGTDGGATDDGVTAGATEGGTLKLWHYEGEDSAMGIAWAEAIRVFEEETGATVELEQKAFEQIQKTAGMVLSSDEGPDIMEYNKGNATAGLLSSQGLLTDLTDVAQERGWTDMLPESIQTTARYENGVMGSGPWYGVPNYGEFVTVYYNKDMFAEYGIEVPTTLAEMEAAMDTFVEAGIVPLGRAGAEYPHRPSRAGRCRPRRRCPWRPPSPRGSSAPRCRTRRTCPCCSRR